MKQFIIILSFLFAFNLLHAQDTIAKTNLDSAIKSVKKNLNSVFLNVGTTASAMRDAYALSLYS